MNPSTISLYLLRAMIFVASIGPAHAMGQEQGTVAYADAVQEQQPATIATIAPAASEAAPQRSITRIKLTATEMPAATKQRDLPTYQAPRVVTHQLARDISTLKAARSALLMQDASHSQQRLASLR